MTKINPSREERNYQMSPSTLDGVEGSVTLIKNPPCSIDCSVRSSVSPTRGVSLLTTP